MHVLHELVAGSVSHPRGLFLASWFTYEEILNIDIMDAVIISRM
jgi:hypothetical protein